MTYISKIVLDTRLPASRYLLASEHRIHAAIMQSFNQETHEEHKSYGGRVLWRVEKTGREVNLYVLSPTKPDWDYVKNKYCRSNQDNSIIIKHYGNVINNIKEEQNLLFKVTLNPTFRKSSSKEIIPIRNNDKVLEWAHNKLTDNGFHVMNISLTEKKIKSFKRNGKNVTLDSVGFEGIISIKNIDKARKALLNGVGRGKSYGLGFLSIAPYIKQELNNDKLPQYK